MIVSDILCSTILFAVPLLLVALGGMFSERSGVINIALEGIMIVGALIGCLFLSSMDTQYKSVSDQINKVMNSRSVTEFEEIVTYCREEGADLPEVIEGKSAKQLIKNYDSVTTDMVTKVILDHKMVSEYTGFQMFVYRNPQLFMIAAILISGLAGMIYSLLLAFASIHLKADQTIGGTALNMLAPALAITLTWAIQGQGQTTILIPAWISISGPTDTFFGNLIFKYCYLTTPVALLLLGGAIVILYKTRLGLRLRSCGEHPQAAASVGISVYKMRYIGVLFSGFLGGIGGLAFTIAAGSGFQSSVAGYGFLALAVMIFGNWKPVSIFFASLFFALFKVIGGFAGTIPFLPKFESIKSGEYIYNMVPYIVTMIVLVLTGKKSRAPKAEGIPYDKGMR